MRALVDDEDLVVLVEHLRRGDADAPEHGDRLDLVGEGDHVERPQRRDREAETREVIEVARERVGIARDVGERAARRAARRARARAGSCRAAAGSRRRRRSRVLLVQAAQRRGDVGTPRRGREVLLRRGRVRVAGGGRERLDEVHVGPRLREREGDRARAAVEIEHARPRLACAPRGARVRGRARRRASRDALGLPAMRLHERAVRRLVRRAANAILGADAAP